MFVVVVGYDVEFKTGPGCEARSRSQNYMFMSSGKKYGKFVLSGIGYGVL